MGITKMLFSFFVCLLHKLSHLLLASYVSDGETSTGPGLCLQSSRGRRDCDGRCGLEAPTATIFIQEAQCHMATARLFISVSSPERASVLGVLAGGNFLHHSSQRGIKTSPIFTDDSELLSVFSLIIAN